jgi:hypothetical protein
MRSRMATPREHCARFCGATLGERELARARERGGVARLTPHLQSHGASSFRMES